MGIPKELKEALNDEGFDSVEELRIQLDKCKLDLQNLVVKGKGNTKRAQDHEDEILRLDALDSRIRAVTDTEPSLTLTRFLTLTLNLIDLDWRRRLSGC